MAYLNLSSRCNAAKIFTVGCVIGGRRGCAASGANFARRRVFAVEGCLSGGSFNSVVPWLSFSLPVGYNGVGPMRGLIIKRECTTNYAP